MSSWTCGYRYPAHISEHSWTVSKIEADGNLGCGSHKRQADSLPARGGQAKMADETAARLVSQIPVSPVVALRSRPISK
jgi:hypothetical protein